MKTYKQNFELNSNPNVAIQSMNIKTTYFKKVNSHFYGKKPNATRTLKKIQIVRKNRKINPRVTLKCKAHAGCIQK